MRTYTIIILLSALGAFSHGAVSRHDLDNIVQSLWKADVNRQEIPKDMVLNLQQRVTLYNTIDRAPQRIFATPPTVTKKSTYKKMIALLDNYNPYIDQSDVATSDEKSEQTTFINSIMGTRVWQLVRSFLQSQGILKDDLTEEVKRIWFREYSRARGVIGSSGFEHVFVGELDRTKTQLSGLHNWVQVMNLEKSGRINYQGYLEQHTKTQVYQVQLKYGVYTKAGNSMFIGTSPEFDMAIYTICFLVRSNQECDITLNGVRLVIQTYTAYNGSLGTAYIR